MSNAQHIDVDASVDIDNRELFLERNFRLIREILIGGGFNRVGATSQPIFENGWVNYDINADVMLQISLINNLVYIKGRIKDGTLGATVFTLPAALRPLKTLFFTAVGGKGTSTRYAFIEIKPTGEFIIDSPPPPVDWVFIPLIIFSTVN